MGNIQADLIILGAGPGGYAAAFYAAEMGRDVTLIEEGERLGGVCLNRGCIPSKALIHATEVMNEACESEHRGITFGKPKVNLDKMREWKESIIEKLSSGVAGLAKKRKVTVIKGRGYFEDSKTLRVETTDGQKFLNFNHAIIAAGSVPALPAAFDLGNKRIMTSTEALEIEEIPKSLLVVGGGYIGMELGTVYASLGSEVTLVEATKGILAGADPDLIRPVMKIAKEQYKEMKFNTMVQKMSTKGKQIKVDFKQDKEATSELYDRVLVSIGRKPNTANLGLENTDIKCDDKGFIKVTNGMQTTVPNVYAIGDIAGGILLAHKAAKEAQVAVNNIEGKTSSKEDLLIPAVVFTNPDVAWVGLTETEAKEQNIKVNVVKFPWGASGRALTYDRTDGLTKLILEPETDRILGVGIVGLNAGELISSGVLAIEMGANAEDLGHTTHPHPTLSETMMEVAESFYGHSAHAVTPKKKK